MSQFQYSQIPTFVPNTNGNSRLYNRVKNRLNLGEQEQRRLIDAVSSTVIRDKLVPPTHQKFIAEPGKPLQIIYNGSNSADAYVVHRHALTQFAHKANLPLTYVSFLNVDGWKRELLAENLNRLYKNLDFPDRSGNPRFLHRIVGREVRGFLSRRFNRHLASEPLLKAFLSACHHVGAVPFDAIVSDVKFALKMYLPYIFEPVQGEYVCVGVEWSNSDFGAGRMQVAVTIWMPRGDRFSVLDHSISRVHIGSVIEESDIEVSDDTAKKEAEAQASAIRDSVVLQLSPDSIENLLGAIASAHEDAVPWHRLKGNLARFLGKKEIDSLHEVLKDEIIDLPPVPKIGGELHPTKWWASQALAWLANKQDDPERRFDLQHASGSFIDMKNKSVAE